MIEAKPWWMSRTIWMGLATAIMAILGAAGVAPVWLDATILEEIVIGILGILTIYFRATAVKEIQPITQPK